METAPLPNGLERRSSSIRKRFLAILGLSRGRWPPGRNASSARSVARSMAQSLAQSPVRELRLALTVEDYQGALAFYRDLGLPVIESWEQPGGSGAILDAGRATL